MTSYLKTCFFLRKGCNASSLFLQWLVLITLMGPKLRLSMNFVMCAVAGDPLHRSMERALGRRAGCSVREMTQGGS